MNLQQKKPIDTTATTKRATEKFIDVSGLVWVTVDPGAQQLKLLQHDAVLKCYDVSTAKNGLGEEKNSYKTPRGWHQVRAKIGAGVPINGVFEQRRFSGTVCTTELDQANKSRDWILTRILWLSGLEPGFNRLGNVDTMQRYVYIHGSPDSRPVGVPSSRGCIRMRNADIIEFFDLVTVGTKVYIQDYS